ncbi:NDP-sugar synthase [Verrucomicrobiota bacterium]
MKPTLVIMAAGMGSRYGGLKQIDAMGPNGEILMEYSVYDAIRAGFGKVVFVIRKDFEDDFRENVGSKFAGKIEVDYAFQSLDDLPEGFTVPEGRVKPWGTSQAVLAAKEVVDTPFVVQNADDFYGAEAYKVIAEELVGYANESADCCLVGYHLRNTLSPNGSVSRGVCEVADGYLSGVVERLKIEENAEGVCQYFEGDTPVDMAGNEICSMNFWGFTPKLFEKLESEFVKFLKAEGQEMKSEWLLPEIIDGMIKSGETQVKVLSSSDKWFGVTYPEDKPTVTAAIAELANSGKYPSPLF